MEKRLLWKASGFQFRKLEIDTDEKVTLKGTFYLNKDNPMELYYQLMDASLN
jgi:hypothetical protein